MGSIRKRADNGFLFFDFRFAGQRCREQTALSDTPANRKNLSKIMQRIEVEISSGAFEYERYFPTSRNVAKYKAEKSEGQGRATADVPQGAQLSTLPLFKDFAETWFAEKEVEWRRTHRISTRADLDRLLKPQFGEKAVDQITKADVLTFRATLAKVNARGKTTPLSPRRINKIMGPLRQILCEAADRFDFRTPFNGVKSLKFRKVDIMPFTLEEVKLILNSVRADFKDYYTVRFFTGMRTGEVDGLKWKFVDFDRRLILVRQTIVCGEEEYTKNDGSQRDIKMSQAVYDALRSQEKSTRHISDFVFCNALGNPLDHKNVTNRVWAPLLRYLGLEYRRPYQCRHTAATLWLAAGENPEWIARQMGHTTTEMLFRVYSRYVPNLTRQDGSAFDRLLLQAGAATAAVGGSDLAINR
ncbi:MAG: site-specific integrase [Betaproteobacteria bacterium]|nr:site-specific integrase [Betaproteobacteria bacterium]